MICSIRKCQSSCIRVLNLQKPAAASSSSSLASAQKLCLNLWNEMQILHADTTTCVLVIRKSVCVSVRNTERVGTCVSVYMRDCLLNSVCDKWKELIADNAEEKWSSLCDNCCDTVSFHIFHKYISGMVPVIMILWLRGSWAGAFVLKCFSFRDLFCV